MPICSQGLVSPCSGVKSRSSWSVVAEVAVILRVLFDDLRHQLLQRLQRLAVESFLPAGLKEAAELLAVLSEHRTRWSLDVAMPHGATRRQRLEDPKGDFLHRLNREKPAAIRHLAQA